MVACEICGADVTGGSAFTCTYCGGTFCPAHRLPFNHACPNIEEWKHSKPQKKKAPVVTRNVPVPDDKKIIIAGGVIALVLIILALWFFRVF